MADPRPAPRAVYAQQDEPTPIEPCDLRFDGPFQDIDLSYWDQPDCCEIDALDVPAAVDIAAGMAARVEAQFCAVRAANALQRGDADTAAAYRRLGASSLEFSDLIDGLYQ